jgi:hypothetical protein
MSSAYSDSACSNQLVKLIQGFFQRSLAAAFAEPSYVVASRVKFVPLQVASYGNLP